MSNLVSDFLHKDDCPALSGVDRLVAIKMEEWFKGTGGSDYPAVIEIAEQLGIRPIQVKNSIINLYEMGYMWLDANARKNKRTNHYKASKYLDIEVKVVNGELIGEGKK